MVTPNTYAVHVSSETDKIEAWLASDEALARQLQEEENSHDATATREFAGNVSLEPSSPAVEYRSANNATQVSREDNVNPNNMSYEECRLLGLQYVFGRLMVEISYLYHLMDRSSGKDFEKNR